MKNLCAKLIIFFFLILYSCWREDDLLRNERIDYFGNELRIDGFYYSYDQGKIINVIFLYRNGIYFLVNSDGKERTNPDEVVTLLTKEHIERCKTNKVLWGIFLLNGNDILIEKWAFAGPGWKSTVIESGTILSDTSFIITKRNDSRAGNKEAVYEYFFYPHSPKPDSTNIFIK